MVGLDPIVHEEEFNTSTVAFRSLQQLVPLPRLRAILARERWLQFPWYYVVRELRSAEASVRCFILWKLS